MKHSKQQNNINYPSELLNPSQNAVVFSLLGKRCYTLATAVVQLVLAEPSSLNRWSHQLTGVACFVKDHPKKSYFIKIYDCDKKTLKWQQEIYLGFEYRSPRPYFHTFEAHDCVVGLNFACSNEAQIFKETIIGKLRDREKRRTDHLRHNGPNQVQLVVPSSMSYNISMQKSQSALIGGLNSSTLSRSAAKSEKKKLDKRDIGLPTNFQHVTHVGFSQKTGFDLDNVNPSMKKDLQKIISTADQQPEPSQYQYNQVDHQHANQFYTQQNQAPPPPPPPVPPMPSPAVLSMSRAHSSGSYTPSSVGGTSDWSMPNGAIIQAPAVPPPPPPPRPLPPKPAHSNNSKPKPAIQINNQPTATAVVPPPPPPAPPMPSKPLHNVPQIGSVNGQAQQQTTNNTTPNVLPPHPHPHPPPPPPPPPPPAMPNKSWPSTNGAGPTKQQTSGATMQSARVNAAPSMNPRDALMAEIRSAASRPKKVNAPRKEVSQSDQKSNGPPLNPRDSLLASIREAAGKPKQKARLTPRDKQIDEKSEQKENGNSGEPNLMSDLFNKLRARREGISGSFCENQISAGSLEPNAKSVMEKKIGNETIQHTVLSKVSSMIPVRVPSPTDEDAKEMEFSDDDWN